ncbi:hypothetical protein KKG41_06510 [Patescibacteria group bacterium]|nr:hypothetical protein [Patescibacteria group bacterium]MBU1890731.1 hypothetical protein [Patescibacteria group bacterium]
MIKIRPLSLAEFVLSQKILGGINEGGSLMMSKVFRLTLAFVIGLALKRLCVPEWLSAHLWAELCLAFGIGLVPYQLFYRYDWRRIRDAYALL